MEPCGAVRTQTFELLENDVHLVGTTRYYSSKNQRPLKRCVSIVYMYKCDFFFKGDVFICEFLKPAREFI